MQRLLLLVLSLSLWCACAPASSRSGAQPRSPARARVDLGASLAAALDAEATDPLAAAPYLDTIDAALAQPGDRWALAAVLAASDALLWRDVGPLGPGVDHAIVHRSNEALVEVTDRLRKAYRETPVTDINKSEEAINQYFDHAGHSKKNLSKWVVKPDELLEKKGHKLSVFCVLRHYFFVPKHALLILFGQPT